MARDDDDDRPRRRRPRDDDEDDDRPSRRRRDEDEDEDDDRPRARRSRQAQDDYDDDRPRKRKKKKEPQQSVPGILSLVTGALALGLSFSCFSGLAVIPGLIGLGLGIVGFLMAQKSRGRQSPILPISGAVLSLAATVVSVIAIVSFARGVKEFQKDVQEAGAKWEKEEAERKVELAKAAGEVKAAGPDNVIRVSAAEFYKLWDDDEDRFDALYKNKVIEVTGTFHEVNFGAGDVYVVMLKAGPDEFDTVDCEFAKDPDTRARLAQLRPGATVTIRGKCLGGSPVLEACILVN